MCAGPMLQLRPMTSAPAACSAGANCSGGVPSRRVAVVLDGHLRDDRQRAHAADGGDRRADLVQVAERLEDEEIDAAVEEGLGLLAEVLLGLVPSHPAPRLDAKAERTDRAGDVGRSARALARQPGSRFVDVAQTIGEAKRAQLDAVGAERVGLEHVRARLRVGLVHGQHALADRSG